MKWTFFLILLLSVPALFACGSKKQMKKLAAAGFAWMQYDETKCDNPWQFNWLVPPTDEQLAAAVKSHLEGGGIPLLDIKTTREEDLVSCEACNCPNGFHYFVKVKTADKTRLKELKFKPADLGKLPK